MPFSRLTCFLLFLSCVGPFTLSAQIIAAPEPQAGTVSGTVVDLKGGVVPGASIRLDGPGPNDHHVGVAGDNGFFSIPDAASATSLHLTVHAEGFKDWLSPPFTLTPGQALEVTDIKLPLAEVDTAVNAIMPEQLAIEQVKAEEKQRLFGVIPNFYVVYDHNAIPLTSKLKFQLAFKAVTDPVTIGGAAFLAGIYQASDTPSYQQGLKGYGQRFGAAYADGFTDVMIGGAILPSLLHQDPRYFYQGTGSIKSRTLHALSAPFIAKGDNGRSQFNYSSVGGDLASGALSNLYYPAADRGVSLVFTGALITTGARMVNALAQEFLFHRFTSKGKNPD
jgi:hypothetical protein